VGLRRPAQQRGPCGGSAPSGPEDRNTMTTTYTVVPGARAKHTTRFDAEVRAGGAA